MRPLFTAYPSLEDVLPCVELADLPTPVMPFPGRSPGWIKRDDLTHPVYGGNKIRKLEFIIGEWRARKIREVITFGAIGTNAGLATALACHLEGVDCRVLLFDQPVSATVRANLQAMRQLGARLDDRGSLFRTVLTYYLHPKRLLSDRYFLFAGCANPAATFAYINAVFELQVQIRQGLLPEPAEIIVPVGSSSTLAGLSLGVQLCGMSTRVLGVRVAPSHLGPFAACTPETVFKQVHDAHAFLTRRLPGVKLPAPQKPVLLDDYYGPGYGEPTPEALAAIARFQDLADLKLEQTYTGKAAACFLERLAKASGPVLFWNTFNSRPLSNLPVSPKQYPLSSRLAVIAND